MSVLWGGGFQVCGGGVKSVEVVSSLMWIRLCHVCGGGVRSGGIRSDVVEGCVRSDVVEVASGLMLWRLCQV